MTGLIEARNVKVNSIGSAATFHRIHLFVKCLCGCGNGRDFQDVTVRVTAAWNADQSELSHYLVRFSDSRWHVPVDQDVHMPSGMSVRGTDESGVFAFPLLRHEPGAFRSYPDSNGHHFAQRSW